MSPVTVVVVVFLCVGTIGLGVGIAIREYLRRRIVWRTLPALSARYIAPASVSANDIARCLANAADALGRYAFPAERVIQTLGKVSIFVVDGTSWTNIAGERVGGETEVAAGIDGRVYVIKVERGLSSLAHELAHVMEYELEGWPDYAHAKWGERGIWTADDAYRSWLQGR